jgi:outer membrane protein OmpA-like peptidoglycan-associated protein
MYGYDEGEEGGRSVGRVALAIGVVIAVALLGWFVALPMLRDGGDGDGGNAVSQSDDASTTAASSTPAGGSTGGTDTAAPTSTSSATTIAGTTTAAASATTVAGTTTAAETTEAPPAEDSTTTTERRRRRRPQQEQPSYRTLPDGSPVPVVAMFDRDTITISGTVPSQAAKKRLETLAIANSKFPDASVVSFVAINPDVPINVGVRVVELTSTRFPDGSDEITPEHAVEFDRVATIMNALPNITALVIGHADQRGDPASNFAISESRARNTVQYLVSKGIAADRLSSRAVGEADLISLNDDAAALALNRRTEFVFYGLLKED